MKRFTFLFLALMSITALRANIIDGSCGDNLSWSYDTETHALVITGSGEMYDYDNYSLYCPWNTVCESITSVTLPSGLTHIGENAFGWCSITTIELPSSLTSIGRYAFRNTRITSVIIPNSVTEIGYGAFCENPYLNSVVLPNKLKILENYVFGACYWLKSINIPASVTEIGSDALSYCEDVYFESTTPATITSQTFKSDVVLHVPCNAVSDYKKAPYWQFLTILGNLDYNFNLYADEGGTAKITNSVCSANTVVIEAFPNAGWKFTGWSDGGKDNPRALLLTGDKSVTAQFEYAPNYYQVNLSGIDYVEGYSDGPSFSGKIIEGTTLYVRAISSCGTFTGWSDGETDSYRSITITQDTTISAIYTGVETYNVSITAGAHGHLSNEKTGTITSCESYFSIEAIPDEGYHFVEWSDGNEGRYRYFEINSDTSVYAIFAKGEAGGKLGDKLYWTYEADINQITVSGTGEMTEEEWFFEHKYYSFDHLAKVVIEEGALSVIKNNFNNLHYLESLSLPASLTYIGESAFEDCRSLAQVTFAANSDLTSIGNWAFYNCHELSSITIPEGVTQIGKAAFYGCTYMSDVKLPASLRQIGDNAFALCQKIGRMDVDAVTPPEVETKTFYAVSRQTPVYVPDESYSTYKNHPLWGELNIIGRSQAPTSLNQTSQEPIANSQKLIKDGQLLILRGDRTYTLTGQEVK